MKSVVLLVISTIVIFLISCSPVSILYTWQAHDYNGFKYKNVLVLCASDRKAYNYFTRALETSLVDAFTDKGIKAVAVSSTPLVAKQFPDSADLNNLALKNHCDAILIAALQDSRIERNYNVSAYMGWGLGWGWLGWGLPISSDEDILYFETRLIDLKTQNIAYLFNSSLIFGCVRSASEDFAESIVDQFLGKKKQHKTNVAINHKKNKDTTALNNDRMLNQVITTTTEEEPSAESSTNHKDSTSKHTIKKVVTITSTTIEE